MEIYDALGLSKSEAVTANTLCVRMNVTQPPFDNQKVRNAVQLAVDNATVLDLGYQGLGRVAENHHVGPMHPEYAPLPPIARDAGEGQGADDRGRAYRHRARAHLARRRLQLATPADAVAAQMRDAGLKVKRTILPGNTFWNNWTGYPFSATEWNMRPLGVQVYALAYRSGGPWNETAFANPEFDTLLTEAYAIADADKRRVVMEKMEKIIQDFGHPRPGLLALDLPPHDRGRERPRHASDLRDPPGGHLAGGMRPLPRDPSRRLRRDGRTRRPGCSRSS